MAAYRSAGVAWCNVEVFSAVGTVDVVVLLCGVVVLSGMMCVVMFNALWFNVVWWCVCHVVQ